MGPRSRLKDVFDKQISVKLYKQFKQHFSPIFLAKIAKFVHKLKLNPASSLFFSKLKLYDVQMLHRQNNLIEQQNQINKRLLQKIAHKKIPESSQFHNQNNNSKQNQQNIVKQANQAKTLRDNQNQKISLEGCQKISRYIEIMLRRYKDYQQFIYHLKTADIRVTQQLQCRQQMLQNILQAKKRMSVLINNPQNCYQNSFHGEKCLNANISPAKQYYHLSMDRKRPYSTQRLLNTNLSNTNRKQKQKTRFQTQTNQNNQEPKLKRTRLFQKKKILKSDRHQKPLIKSQNRLNQELQNKIKKQQSLQIEKNLFAPKQISQIQSQKIFHFASSEFQYENQKRQVTCKQLSDPRKSHFYVEALRNFNRYQKSKFNDSNNKINTNWSKKNLKDQSCNKQQQSRLSLLSNSSLEKNKQINELIDFIVEQQKNSQTQQRQIDILAEVLSCNSKNNKRDLQPYNPFYKQSNNLFDEQNQQTQKKQYFNLINAVNRKANKNIKRRIGQSSESQKSSILSTVINLKENPQKNMRQRRNAKKIETDMQSLFKRLVSDTSVRNLIQSSQIKQIQKQNIKNKQKGSRHKMKNKKTLNSLQSLTSIVDQQNIRGSTTSRNFIQQPQYLSTNFCAVTNQDIKQLRQKLKPIDRYSQSKILAKYRINNGIDGVQFRYNLKGHLQFNHEYVLRFNSVQRDQQRQKYIQRIKIMKRQDLKMQMCQAFAKKAQQYSAPLQKSLDAQNFYIQ